MVGGDEDDAESGVAGHVRPLMLGEEKEKKRTGNESGSCAAAVPVLRGGK